MPEEKYLRKGGEERKLIHNPNTSNPMQSFYRLKFMVYDIRLSSRIADTPYNMKILTWKMRLKAK